VQNIGIVTRVNENQWGGDLKALYTVRDGLRELGHNVVTGSTVNKVINCDQIILSNTCLDQSIPYETLKRNNKKYSIIGFHEDFIKYFGPCMGFAQYIANMIDNKREHTFEFTLDKVLENPEIIKYFAPPPIKSTLYNYNTLRDANVCIANSNQEKDTMLRDCKSCNAQVVYWSPGFADEWSNDISSEFLKRYNLASKDYLLQVGRFETRKNQLATILATRNIDIPLVFIATKGYQPWYDKLVAECIKRYRKHRTIIISDYLKSQKIGNIETYNTLEDFNGKLPTNFLQSAFTHAKVHVHPAFYELPGYTYLEAASTVTPSIAGKWCSIKEYGLGDLIKLSTPYHINDIESNITSYLNDDYVFSIDNINLLKRRKIDVGIDIDRLILQKEAHV
jgi:glycosyltransferase involved in cell wall biosynthesis